MCRSSTGEGAVCRVGAGGLQSTGGLGLECGGGFRKEELDRGDGGDRAVLRREVARRELWWCQWSAQCPPASARLRATCFPHIRPFTPHTVLGGRYDLTLLCR